jgi:outer membrane protein assembly factor BamB
MADKLTSGCLDCFQRFDNRLVVLTTGGTVQGIEAQTGQLIWSLRLNFEVANRLTAAGDRLIVYDRSEDNRDELMLVVNPVNGDVVSRTVISECAGRGFDQYHPNFYNPQQDELYLIFGDIIGPVCVQAWNVAGQQIVREIILEGTSLPSDFREYEHEQLRAIFAGEKLYLSAQQKAGNVEEGTVISIDVATGQWQILAHTPDYELIPLGMADDLLIVRAIRSRGTSRSELWGLDLASGEPRWQYVLQAQRWFKETGSEPAWDWRLSPHGLVVLQLFSDPDQLVVEKLNPQTGVSSGQNTIPLGDDFLTGIVWTDEAAWLALRKIYAVDLATSSLSYTWP